MESEVAPPLMNEYTSNLTVCKDVVESDDVDMVDTLCRLIKGLASVFKRF